MASALLGIDVGTTGMRAAIFSAHGEKIADASEPHGVASPHPGWAESDAEGWWRSVGLLTRRLGASLADVACVGVVGQAPTAVLVDARGQAIRPAILWLDTRSDAEAREVARALGCTEAEGRGGNRVHPYFLGPKLAWLARHDAASLARAKWVLESHSFLVFRLTGEASIDHSTAALRAPLFDLPSRAWSSDACAALGLPASALPPVRRAHEVVGKVTREAAAATGIPAGTPVVAGGGDFAASTLAAGALEEGEACLMLGTAGNLLMPSRSAMIDPRLINSHHVGVDRYLSLGGTLCGGAQEWFRRTCAAGASHEELDAEAAACPAGAGGVVFLPYLQGERTPLWDVHARGAYLGLELGTGRGAMWRALLEGIALSFRHCQSVVAERGVTLARVTATNGAGKSALFRQILCDVLGTPLEYGAGGAGTVAGAAILAGLGAGLVADASASRAWRGALVEHAPDARAHARYEEIFARRLALYESIRRA
jgi:xylulokinase